MSRCPSAVTRPDDSKAKQGSGWVDSTTVISPLPWENAAPPFSGKGLPSTVIARSATLGFRGATRGAVGFAGPAAPQAASARPAPVAKNTRFDTRPSSESGVRATAP